MKKRTESTGEIFGRKVASTISSADLFSSERQQDLHHVTFRLDTEDGIGLPMAIIPANHDSENLFVAVATYYPNHSPISALIHVIESEAESSFLKSLQAGKRLSKMRLDSHRAYLGAALGEAMLASLGSFEPIAPSYAACKRTLAFCLCRASEIYGTLFDSKLLSDKWSSLRKMTGLAVSNEAIKAVQLIGALTHKCRHDEFHAFSNQNLWDELERVIDGGSEARLLDMLVDSHPNAAPYARDLAGPFDGRLVAFTKIVEAINVNSGDQLFNDMAVGFFCNRIQPGSFTHTGVLMHLSELHPTSLIWYGMFSAISDRNEPFSFSSSLVAKLERDLRQVFSFACRPESDISFEELQILSRGRLKHESINPGHPRALLVSLLPGVNVYTRFGVDPSIPVERSRASEAFDNREKVTKLLEDALSLLKRPGENNKATTYAAVARKRKRPQG